VKSSDTDVSVYGDFTSPGFGSDFFIADIPFKDFLGKIQHPDQSLCETPRNQKAFHTRPTRPKLLPY
jgi:hypothetical protein